MEPPGSFPRFMPTITSRSCPVNLETLKSNHLRRLLGQSRAWVCAVGTSLRDCSRLATNNDALPPSADDLALCAGDSHLHTKSFQPQLERCQLRIAQTVRTAERSCSWNHLWAGSLVSRGCHAMKYGKDLISRGASTTRTRARPAVILANLRGTVRTKSVCATAKIRVQRMAGGARHTALRQ